MHSDRRDNQDNRTDLRTLTLTLTVSLFIAMLAFFMILNSYAVESEKKLSKARDSLTNAFGLIGQGRAAVDTNSTGTGTAGDMEVMLASRLRSVLPDVGFQSHKTVSGQIMSVIIPHDELIDRWPELRSRMSDLMTNLNPGGRYRLQILSLKDAATAADLASFAANMTEDGVPAKLLSVGYEAQGRNVIELRFIKAGGA